MNFKTNIMNQFIPYKQALELKELGFDERTLTLWHKDKAEELITLPYKGILYGYSNSLDEPWISAPLWQQAFSFFREKYKLHSTITSISQESWQWHITKPGESLGKLYNEDFYTYEEAEQACLQELIELCKEKKS